MAVDSKNETRRAPLASLASFEGMSNAAPIQAKRSKPVFGFAQEVWQEISKAFDSRDSSAIERVLKASPLPWGTPRHLNDFNKWLGAEPARICWPEGVEALSRCGWDRSLFEFESGDLTRGPSKNGFLNAVVYALERGERLAASAVEHLEGALRLMSSAPGIELDELKDSLELLEVWELHAVDALVAVAAGLEAFKFGEGLLANADGLDDSCYVSSWGGQLKLLAESARGGSFPLSLAAISSLCQEARGPAGFAMWQGIFMGSHGMDFEALARLSRLGIEVPSSFDCSGVESDWWDGMDFGPGFDPGFGSEISWLSALVISNIKAIGVDQLGAILANPGLKAALASDPQAVSVLAFSPALQKVEGVDLMEAAGFDPQPLRTPLGDTPLHLAMEGLSGGSSTKKLCIALGKRMPAWLSVKNGSGSTPLAMDESGEVAALLERFVLLGVEGGKAGLKTKKTQGKPRRL